MKKAVVFSLAGVIALSCVVLPGLLENSVVRAQEEAPQLRRLRPRIITTGTQTFTIRIEGRDFAIGANVLFDGVPLASPRVSPKGRVLLAEVDASLIASAGEHSVQVINPDGMTSNSDTLTVQDKDPDLTIRLVGNAAEEDLGLDAIPTVETDSFSDSSDILVWGRAAPDAADPSGALVQISNELMNDPAEIPITLRDRKGNISNTEIFFIVPKPPEIVFLDPGSLEVGTEDVLLEVHGVFKDEAVVVVNNVQMPTTLGKNGRLEVTLPASLVGQPGQIVVRVEQDGIQSADAILPVSPTDDPFIFTTSPARFRLGERKPTIDLIGANLDSRSTVNIDGVETFIRDGNRRRLRIAVPEDLSLGPHVVQVIDRDGNEANSISFEVVEDVEVTTFAGDGRFGLNLECVSADQAHFVRPRRMSFGPDGLLYIADQQNHVIRTLNVDTGQTCTVVGTGKEGYHDSGNSQGEPPTLSFPSGAAVDAAGTIYITENGNNVVRRVQRTGGTNTVDTFAGAFVEVANADKQKRLNSTREGVTGYRTGAALSSELRQPDEILVAPDGAIYFTDAGNHVIRRIVQNGGQPVVEIVAGNGVPGFADGAAENARFNTPTGLALSPDGNFLFVADTQNNRVRIIDLVNRRVSTLAGGGSGDLVDAQGGEAILFRPIGIAVDSDNVVYVAELTANDIRRIDPAGNVTSFAGSGNSKLRDGPGLEAKFNQPRGLAIDRQRGVLYVADYENFVIRRIALR
ncbi:MAG TPA: SMP-30/gluconolactonase/LRE family protein [Blastocatellia bacterium]|nr:SMP-30/gluconolactonase/LRE family protein [Blastocatellia bacterium]